MESSVRNCLLGLRPFVVYPPAVVRMLAGLRAPSMGSTGAAKESLQWLAVPSSALCCIGLLAVAVLAGRALFSKPHADAL